VSDIFSSLRWMFVGATFLLIVTLIFINWMDFWLGRS
jgi:hypothetical protein